MDIVEDQAIGYQMIELHALSLLYSAVVCNDALSAKKRPLGEAIKRLALVRGGLNGGA
jgi:hypothetical protein